MAWLLERQAALPHVEGLSGEQRVSYDEGMKSLPAAQGDRPVDAARGLSIALEQAQERRRNTLDAILLLAVMYDPSIQ